jgi:hypothetical protein
MREMKTQIVDLVKQIKAENRITVNEQTILILYNCLCIYKNTNFYLALLYKLIFHTAKHQPEMACHILCSFINFGQSNAGESYKPMLDYFAIEAFEGLYKINGWSILKPCVSILRNTSYNYANEPLFQHIVAFCVKQLKQDLNEIPNISDLCYYLPREKSMTWGWFSYAIAHEYFSDSNYRKIGSKETRRCMMFYRKLLTKLRKEMTFSMKPCEPVVQTEYVTNEEIWTNILNELEVNDYKWASDIINEVIAFEEQLEPNEVFEEQLEPNEVFEESDQSEVIELEQIDQSEVFEESDQSDKIEVIDLEQIDQSEVFEESDQSEVFEESDQSDKIEVIEPNEVLEPKKEKGWLYSLFGWS